ncbi:MAG: type IV pili methyl-accepting chemotaxis transducer N-terminal domain-containing protein [Pseudomonas sp.]|uniref:type IV pili methyl-accepting chemotaxis transducer N-terminal domain-containing protein n=1 Tax=Pseudomonas sp. TaxID=306 RepID=UPI0027232AB6|nr:type IV pili methyl-accepting chemotaxis transducer N-terminal domain-containing protein [Pseudomonas sp.]
MRLSILPTALLLLGALLALPCSATINDAEAMNLSGMQRMLSQRMAKTYLMIGSGVRAEVANEQFDQSLAKFESNYQALSDYAPNSEIRQALVTAGSIWQEYRQLLLNSPSRENAPQVLALSDQLLGQCEKVVQLIQQHTGSSSAVLVNRSGRQRMLSQRIAKLYLARSWRLPGAELEQQFQQAVDEFDRALSELQNAQQNTPEINAALHKVEAQWTFSRAGFRLSNDSRYVPTVITTTTETLLRQMNELTSAYEAVMRADS